MREESLFGVLIRGILRYIQNDDERDLRIFLSGEIPIVQPSPHSLQVSMVPGELLVACYKQLLVSFPPSEPAFARCLFERRLPVASVFLHDCSLGMR